MLWFDRLELNDVTVYDNEGNRMIGVKELMINFKLAHLFSGKDINIDGIFVDSAHVFLTKVNETDSSRNLNINVFINRINERLSGGGGGGNPPKINIGEAFLNQSQFTLVDQDKDSIRYGFDYNHFSLAVDEGQLKSFVVLGDTIEFDVRTLIAQDLKSKFKVNQLSTFFRICQKSMEFINLDLSAGNSHLSDTIIFTYDSQLALNDFNHAVDIHAHFSNTTIYPKDLAVFAPGVEQVGKPILVTGDFNGKIDRFKLTNMLLQVGGTQLAGSLNMEGLPLIDETFIILNLKNSRVNPNDLAFLFNEQTMERLRPMGTVSMDGQFLGYPNDFVANGTFTGQLGTIRSDINFKVNDKNIDLSEYSGKLSLENFQLGTYLNDTIMFQQVNMNGSVLGQGLTESTADFLLNGNVKSIGINGYNYNNIKTDARFARGLFRGLANINDPNLEMSVRGSVDLRDHKNEIKVSAQLDTAFLHKLNLARDSVFLHTTLEADFRGLSLDSLQGTADFNDFYIAYRDENLALKQIHIDAQRTKTKRSLNLNSTLADAEIKGNFSYTDIARDIQILIHEIALNIRNDKNEINSYYQQKTYKPKAYEAFVKVDLKKLDPLINLIDLDLQLSDNITIDGRFKSGYTTIFNAYTEFDSLTFQGKKFINSNIELTTSKITDSTSVLSMLTVSSEKQLINSNLTTKNLLTELIWNKNHIDITLDVDHQSKLNNYLRLSGYVDFLKDSTLIGMNPSSLQLLERNWSFKPDNYISKRGKEWNVHNLVLEHASQTIGLHGRLSTRPNEVISLLVNQVDLSLLNALTVPQFTGVLDARIDLSDFYKKPAIQNQLDIQDLTVDKFLVGNIHGENQWDTLQNQFNINVFIDREAKRIIDLQGSYKPTRKNSPLQTTAQLENANLKILEPFLSGIFSNIGGTVSGDFTINGQLAEPDIRGEGIVKDGQMMVTYLKTHYLFTGTIGLTPTSINFKNIELIDLFKNKGHFNGTITHKGFNKMNANLAATFQNLQVLNTTIKDNSLFYGQAYATGNVNFTGPISNLKISSTARTEKNTRLYVPLSGSTSVDKKEFISFVNFKDSTRTQKANIKRSNKVDITGLTFDFNIDVTPDAYCEIIFDQKAGDIIRGRGNGDLKLQLDTKGEFNMFGPFEFTEGWYNFTLYDVVNKEFAIKKGSRITWYGDPYQATVNISASYNQLASLSPIIASQTTNEATLNSPQLQRKYPVQVQLKLDGSMMKPDISFDIIANDLPKNIQTENGQVINLDLEFAAFKNKLDEQELNRQVFSLIVLRRLSPLNAGIDASGSLFNSVSELLSNQLSYWMSQVDEDLVIDVDLGSMDEERFNTFQLRLSYTFLNGRLRVTGDGTFNNSSNANANAGTQSNPSNVTGDWTVDYMLTPDGKLRIKMYSRTNVNPLLSSVNTNQNTITTGASLIHTQSFNELKDLWRRSRTKKVKQQQEKGLKPEKKGEGDEEEDSTSDNNSDALKEENEIQ